MIASRREMIEMLTQAINELSDKDLLNYLNMLARQEGYEYVYHGNGYFEASFPENLRKSEFGVDTDNVN